MACLPTTRQLSVPGGAAILVAWIAAKVESSVHGVLPSSGDAEYQVMHSCL